MWTLPNILTLSRIVLLPLLIALLYLPFDEAAWAALIIYVIACLTDFLDGFAARSLNSVSSLGRFLDPISDKIFVSCLIVALAGFDRLDGVWLIPALVIFIREFMVAGLREFLGPKDIQMPVTPLAKWKTTVQMIALGFLIVGDAGNTVLPFTLYIGQVLLTVAAVLTAMTGWHYLKYAFPHLK